MPQVAWADRLTLPPDSTGKPTGMVPVAVAGGTLYLPASVMVDAAGNTIDSAAAAPAGTERGLVTRNIPSGSQAVSGTVGLAAGTNQVGTTLGPTLTKGTQGATGYSVQNLKDSGRVNMMWVVDSFTTTATAEQLLTITESRDGAATSTFTSKVITSGKRLRITSLALGVQAAGSAPVVSRVWLRIRVNTAGAVTTTSPLQFTIATSTPATAKTITNLFDDFPDGLEFAGTGTTQIGVTVQALDWVSGTNTPGVTLTLFGFEY
jgi:hypothetical protein